MQISLRQIVANAFHDYCLPHMPESGNFNVSEMRLLLGLVLVLSWAPHHVAPHFDDPGHLTNEFAVVIDGGDDVADLVAYTHGFDRVMKVLFIFLFGSSTVTRCGDMWVTCS